MATILCLDRCYGENNDKQPIVAYNINIAYFVCQCKNKIQYYVVFLSILSQEGIYYHKILQSPVDFNC